VFVLSGFADEISPDLTEQLDVLTSLDIRYLELRGVWGQSVLELADDQVAQVKRALADRGMGVSAIGSPIGKIGIEDPMDPHLDAFRRALDLAEELETPYIRMFSFFVPEGRADAYRDEVMRRLSALLDEADGRPVTLLHENESKIYGDIPRRCLDILETMDSPQLQMTFDPANFVMNGVRPYDDAFEMLADHIAYLHIKDGIMAEKRVVPAGEGDGQMKQVLQALHERGFDGFASLEPHLAHAGAFAGFSGPELFGVAANALRKLIDEVQG
jgi:sugar phosphate isomerase/epimerase